jgi:hypothetical protein
MNKRFIGRLAPSAILGGLAAVSASANAADTVDFSALTSGIAIAGVVTAILAVAGIKVAPAVASYGARKILGMIGR